MNDWVRDVYENHRRLLFRVAWLVLRQADLAEDAVYDAFSRNRPHVNGNAKGYVLRAVRNAALDLRRQLARRETVTVDGWEFAGGDDSLPHQAAVLNDEVSEALEQLDEMTREIIHLHIHENMTFREIGELTGVPLATAASRYRRGLKQIETAVQDLGDQTIRLKPLSVSVTAVKGREPLDGVKLDVGKPILTTTSINTSVVAKLGKASVISIDSPRGGRILISVKVLLVKPLPPLNPNRKRAEPVKNCWAG